MIASRDVCNRQFVPFGGRGGRHSACRSSSPGGRSRWPGLILPVISFLVSLLYLFNLADTGSVVQNILMALVTLLVSNLPTLVLLAIYWAGRERVRKQE